METLPRKAVRKHLIGLVLLSQGEGGQKTDKNSVQHSVLTERG